MCFSSNLMAVMGWAANQLPTLAAVYKQAPTLLWESQKVELGSIYNNYRSTDHWTLHQSHFQASCLHTHYGNVKGLACCLSCVDDTTSMTLTCL